MSSDQPEEPAVDPEGHTLASEDGESAVPPKRSVAVNVGDTLGRYILEGELGEGGMATVFEAEDRELRRKVAIKVLFPHLAKRDELAGRFAREARAVAALDHPNILRVFDVGGGDGGVPPFIVLELVRGESLREHIGESGEAILPEVVAAMGCILCDALEHAHAAGVIHRDLKPANVMVSEGRLVLADFGVAQVAELDSLVTKTGALLGTPAFMSPEQAFGSELDVRSDLYSLGATMYQLATGSVPYGGSPVKVVAAIAAHEYTSASRRNPAIGELGSVIDKLMSREPDQRFADAAALRARLAQIVAATGDEPAVCVERYFADPAEYSVQAKTRVLSHCLEVAQDYQKKGQGPRAMALLDRVLTLEPGHALATELLRRMERRQRWPLLAGALLVVAALAGGILWWSSRSEEDPHELAGAVTIADAGSALETSPDAEATPTLFDASIAPAAIDAGIRRPDRGKPVPNRRPRVVADAAPRPVDAGIVDAPTAKPQVPPIVPAQLSVDVDSWCNVSIDGVSVGRAARGPFSVSPGPHRVSCSQGPGRPSEKKSITAAAGARLRVKFSLSSRFPVTVVDGGLRVNGRPVAKGSALRLESGRRHRLEVIKGGKVVNTRFFSVRGPCRLRAAGCFAQ